MSQEVSIVAIIQPAEGKLPRLKELFTQTLAYMKENEPGTLEFSYWEENGTESPRIFMFERYASQQALKEHEGSESYGKFFKTVTEEELLAGSPVIVRGQACDAFRR